MGTAPAICSVRQAVYGRHTTGRSVESSAGVYPKSGYPSGAGAQMS